MELHRHIFGSMRWKCWASLRPTTYWRCPVARHGAEWQLADMTNPTKILSGRTTLKELSLSTLHHTTYFGSKETTFTTFPTCWVAECIFSRKALHQISMHIAEGLRCIVAQAQSAVLASRDDHRPRFTSKLVSWQRSLAKAHRVKDASCGSIRPNVSCARSTKSRGKCKRSRAKAQVVEATAAGCIPTAVDRYSTGMQQCNTQDSTHHLGDATYILISLRRRNIWELCSQIHFWDDWNPTPRFLTLGFSLFLEMRVWAPERACCCSCLQTLDQAFQEPLCSFISNTSQSPCLPCNRSRKTASILLFYSWFRQRLYSPNIVGVRAFMHWCPHELRNSMHD